MTTLAGEEHHQEQAMPNASLEKGVDGRIDVDILGPLSGTTEQLVSNFRGSSGTIFNSGSSLLMPQRAPTHQPSIATPSLHPALLTSGISPSVLSGASPMLSPVDIRPPMSVASKPTMPVILPQAEPSTGTNVVPTASNFLLPYRMLFAVITMDSDTVAIYDTQQAGPVCMLTKLHYDEFTDLTWYAISTNVFEHVLIPSNLKVSRWTMSDSFLSRCTPDLDRIR